MSKWYSKRKVQMVNQQQLSAQTDEFNELFTFVVKCFRMFGLCPARIISVKGIPNFELSRVLMTIVLIVLLSCWCALLASFFLEYRTPMITGIANHIQFITNVLALTVTLVDPILKLNELNAILKDFNVIDDELSYFSVKLFHKQMKSSFWKCFMAFILFLVLSTIYDGHVLLILGQDTQVWLWFYHLLPFMLYSMAFMNAFTMIKWVKIRIQQLNSLIEQYHRYPLMDKTGHLKLKTASIITVKVEEDIGDAFEMTEEFAINNRILRIVSKTIDLAARLESYNGLLFLFGYLALFSVTTIQVYYCYLHVTIAQTEHGFSINSLGLSLVIIMGNLVAILALPYICEQVANESKTLMSYLSKLSMKYGHNVQSSIWFPNLISSIKFSALGFFNINYNMLSGFFAALITYLIIFIQFNSIVPMDSDYSHQSRTNTPRVQVGSEDQKMAAPRI